jgi:threonine/homoserine/homoserine lactone efflux protein
VNPGKGAVAGQILFLGFTFVVLGICSDGLYALLAGTMGHWLKGNLRFLRAQRYLVAPHYSVVTG